MMQNPLCEPHDPGILATIAQPVTWALVILGWIIVHWTAKVRALRQEELARIGEIAARISSIRDMAISYYTTASTAADAPITQARLKYELQSLASWADLLRLHRPGLYDLTSEQMALRKAVTGGEFESADRLVSPPDGLVVHEIWSASDRYVMAMHEEFKKAQPWL